MYRPASSEVGTESTVMLFVSSGPVGPGMLSADASVAVPEPGELELEVVFAALVHAASAIRAIATTSGYTRLPIFVDWRNSMIAPSYTWYAA
jgi:hypothetical protein